MNFKNCVYISWKIQILTILWHKITQIVTKKYYLLSKFSKLHNLETNFCELLRHRAPPFQKIKWNFMTTVWWLPDDCLMTAWRLPDNCLTTAWQLPDNALTTAMKWQIKVNFNAFFSLGDPATQTKCYVSEGLSIDCGSAYCQEISGLFHFIMTFSSHVNNQSWILNLPICFKIY